MRGVHIIIFFQLHILFYIRTTHFAGACCCCCCGIRFYFYWSVVQLQPLNIFYIYANFFSFLYRISCVARSLEYFPCGNLVPSFSHPQLASIRFSGSSHIHSSVVYYVRSFVRFFSSPLYRFFFSRPDCDKRNMYSRRRRKKVNHIHVNSIWESKKKRRWNNKKKKKYLNLTSYQVGNLFYENLASLHILACFFRLLLLLLLAFYSLIRLFSR